MKRSNLIKIGGWAAILWVVLQIIGNSMHPQLDSDTEIAMTHIASNKYWFITHIILILDYLVILFVIVGMKEALSGTSWISEFIMPLMTIAIAVGIIQVATHPTVLKCTSDIYANAGANEQLKQDAVRIYESFWEYNLFLEIGHLLIIYFVIFLIGVEMMKSSFFPKWQGILGLSGGIAAGVALLTGELFLGSSKTGDLLTFGFGLLPLAVWLIAVGIKMIRH